MGSRNEKPERSCLACRTKKRKDRLLRFVLSPDREVLPDPDARLPGRGAYTCYNRNCLAIAVRQRAFNRAFREEIPVVSFDDLDILVKKIILERVLGILGLANKAGKIIAGSSLVEESLKSSMKPGIVIIASDVSEAIGAKIRILAEHNNVPVLTQLYKNDLGAILGKAPRSAIAVKTGGFVPRIIHEISRYRNFLGEVHDI